MDVLEAGLQMDSSMQQIYRRIIPFALVALTLPLCSSATSSPFSGRWDLTIVTTKGAYPSWMEFADESGTPAIRIVGRFGSVHAVTNSKVDGPHLTFDDGAEHWEVTVQDRKLTGKSTSGDVTGVPAPHLISKDYTAWSDPEPLFDGRDLAGWEPSGPGLSHWVAQNGELQNSAAGANIRSARKFGDFKLHIEYNCPPGGNSGVYLRGRYEIQVEYEPPGKNDAFHAMGSIYGFIAPVAEVHPRPGQWEAYDVTLVGRNVTVMRDGVRIIDRADIPGITGGALDSREGEPGPLYLQGDHTDGLKYRNITVSVPR
jgi:Domain of Unknown Function (DUF1080)